MLTVHCVITKENKSIVSALEKTYVIEYSCKHTVGLCERKFLIETFNVSIGKNCENNGKFLGSLYLVNLAYT